MKRRSIFAAALVLIATAGTLQADELILRPQTGVSADIIAQRYGFTLVSTVPGQNLALVRVPNDVPQATIDWILANDRDVLGLERSPKLKATPMPGEPALTQSVAAILESYESLYLNYYGTSAWDAYVNQSAATQIHLPDAHKLATGSGTIAIIDTGVDTTHPALLGVLVPGYDFVHEVHDGSEWSDVPGLEQSVAAILETYYTVQLNQSVAAILEGGSYPAPPLPEFFGHGTMVAGLIHLTAPTSKIMPLKAFTSDGYTTFYDICRAIYYAADHGAKVINLSFASLTPSKELYNALRFAARKGVIAFAAVGNGALSTDTYPVYPADYTPAFGIGSTSPGDHRSSFSNYGEDVTIGAPGEALLTTYPGGIYAMVWGTSFSTAWATGSAALFLQRDSDLTTEDVKSALSSGAWKLKASEGMGFGRIDLYNSLAAVPTHHHPPSK
jgi:subtilisin family serine protease